MSSPVKTRLYQPQYREAFRELNLQWIKKYFQVEKKDLEQLGNPEECLAGGGQIFFVLRDELVVGTCALYKIGTSTYELAKMAVHPEYRGHGLGDEMMLACEKWAREQGGKEIMILSNTLLEPAIQLYKKHGFEVVHLGSNPDYARANIELRKLLTDERPSLLGESSNAASSAKSTP